MKVAHINKKVSKPINFDEWLEYAKACEKNGDIKGAIEAYEKCVKLQATYENGYNRLMILYRKEKEHSKELKIIAAGIKAFQDFYGKRKPPSVSSAIRTLSNALLKSTGLVDKKGNYTHDHQPIARWKQRAQVLKRRQE